MSDSDPTGGTGTAPADNSSSSSSSAGGGGGASTPPESSSSGAATGDGGGGGAGSGGGAASGNGGGAGSGGGAGAGGGSGEGSGAGDGPQVTATITIDPDPGTPQDPHSYQVPNNATLTLKWSATNAATVNIEPGVGEGLQIEGSAPIAASDATFTVVAVAADGQTQSPVFTISISTHDPDEQVSGHSAIDSGLAKVVSFGAQTKDGTAVTHGLAGDVVELIAVVSDSTDTLTINDQNVSLTETGDGNKTGTLEVTLADTGDFSCEASIGGGSGDVGSCHLDIGAGEGGGSGEGTGEQGLGSGDASSAGAGSGETSGGASVDGSGEGAATGSAAGSGAATGSGAGTSDASGAGSTDGSATDDKLVNARWDQVPVHHGESHTMSVDAAGCAGHTVYFLVKNSEDGGNNWTVVGEYQGTMSSGQSPNTATAQVSLPDEDGAGSGAGSTDGSSGNGGSSDSGSASSDGNSGSDDPGNDGWTIVGGGSNGSAGKVYGNPATDAVSSSPNTASDGSGDGHHCFFIFTASFTSSGSGS